MTPSRQKYPGFLLSAWLALGGGVPLRSAPTAPVPGDDLLFIHVDYATVADPKDYALYPSRVLAALAALPNPPRVAVLKVNAGSSNGIADDLAAAGLSLSAFCQVWDFRFLPDHNNISYLGGTYADTLTNGCTSCDYELFHAFLQGGGHLTIQGENEEFYGRNPSVMQFIYEATGFATHYPNVHAGTFDWSAFDNGAPDFFRSNTNALSTLGTHYPGSIPLNALGSGKPLTTGVVGGIPSALDLVWEGSQLAAGNGKLFVNFDFNSFYDARPGSSQYLQNVYTAMSTCHNYTLSKSVAPAEVCLGEEAVFRLCYANTGTRTLPDVTLTDTISSCLAYLGALPAPSAQGGRTLSWRLGDVAPGARACVDIRVLVRQGAPCP